MKNVLIVEHQTEALIKESMENSSKILLSGSFTEFNIENRNKRFYTAPNFIPVMNKLLEKKKMLGVVYGEFDHPDVFDITGKNVSHAIESLTHNEELNRVDGSIALLSTHWGKEAKAIINDGYPLFVSSRAAGVTDHNGGVQLNELFTYDVVIDPGFASSRVCVNESLGYSTNENVNYRIYEMKDGDVNNLHLDNKNDNKTKMDLNLMHQILSDESVKIKTEIMEKIKNGKTDKSEILAISEKYDSVVNELNSVTEYLKYFKTQMSTLVKTNNELKKTNETLTTELNESILFSNNLSSGLKKLNEKTITIDSRLDSDEKMLEYVANHTKANILMTEDLNKSIKDTNEFVKYVAKETEITQKFAESIAKETEITQMFAESIAKETEIAQMFAESIAKETEITQMFAESIAKETEITQMFAEYTANEAYKDQVFLDYISEKVDGVIGYNLDLVNTLQSTTKVNENATSNTIHTLTSIEDYLGLKEEREFVNNITEDVEEETEETEEELLDDVTSENNEESTDIPEGEDLETPELLMTAPESGEFEVPEIEGEAIEGEEFEVPTIEGEEYEAPTDEISLDNLDPIGEIEVTEPSLETTLLSALVKVLGTDDTGIIMEITADDKVIIQKSGTEETMELGHDQYEVMDIEENFTNTVSDVLAEIKKQKVLANKQPHFMSFMTEQQVVDFKLFDRATQEAILLAMDNSEYYTNEDVLNIIGKTLNEKTGSYEDKLISNVPDGIKESWNALSQDQKISVITESKYFTLSTSADMKNFWETRPFAKAITSPQAILIKESIDIVDNDKLSDEYINAFLASVNMI